VKHNHALSMHLSYIPSLLSAANQDWRALPVRDSWAVLYYGPFPSGMVIPNMLDREVQSVAS